jgi:lambda repressor-like predicted transcriptional regulator
LGINDWVTMSSATDPKTKTGNCGADAPNIVAVTELPKWLPDAVRLYLDHTEDGQSLRSLARRDGLHASTVLRHVRRCEMRRDDPLVDEALSCLQQTLQPEKAEIMQISEQTSAKSPLPNDVVIAAEALRVLRRLAETGAFLAIAPDMDKAAVMRAFPDGRVMRMAVLDRGTAQAFALKDWICVKKSGGVTTYEITNLGRAEVKARLDDRGMAEGRAQFEDWEGAKRVRYNLSESPVAVLGRRRDKDGKAYLEPDLIHAAERLREDYELAQMGGAQDWEKIIAEGRPPAGGTAATARVAAALIDLGPGLGDVALQVCCALEGVEVTEQRLGWAARSGKVVLRIALQRLWRHYQETYGRSGPLIG